MLFLYCVSNGAADLLQVYSQSLQERQHELRTMKTRLIGWTLVLLPLPVWGIGFVYTGVGGGGRELMELTETRVQIQIQDRVAVTRMDQVFTNRSSTSSRGSMSSSCRRGR